MSEPSTDDILDLLGASQARLVTAFDELGDDLGRQSYCDDWSVAQVASHLGSGTEIFRHYLEAGVRAELAPGGELNQPIWDAWNARTPADQVSEAIAVNAAFLEAAAALDEQERSTWRLQLFGMDLDLPAFLRMRLSEHVIHTWDVAVAVDPASTLPDDAADLIAESLGRVAGWSGKPSEEQVSVEVRTSSPEHAYRLDVGPSGPSLSPSLDDTAAATLSLPTEAFVRLVFGRLDADHTPAATSGSGVDLDLLRRVFPGL